MIKDNLLKVQSTIVSPAHLIAVSKTKPVEAVQEAYEAGQRLFGENHALEMRDKHAVLPQDIEWHFIGHLQSNKVKYIAPFVSLIHSIDSLGLLQVVDKEAAKNGRTIDCLLQFHVAAEETKFGLNKEEAQVLLPHLTEMEHVHIIGIMGMATNTDDEDRVRADFKQLKAIFDWLKNSYFANDAAFRELSMGMSGDYMIALQEGSTMVRVGSAIFGARNYDL